jgi:hypothetical protein
MKVMNSAQFLDDIVHHQLNFGLLEAQIDQWEDVLSYPFILREQGSETLLPLSAAAFLSFMRDEHDEIQKGLLDENP